MVRHGLTAPAPLQTFLGPKNILQGHPGCAATGKPSAVCRPTISEHSGLARRVFSICCSGAQQAPASSLASTQCKGLQTVVALCRHSDFAEEPAQPGPLEAVVCGESSQGSVCILQAELQHCLVPAYVTGTYPHCHQMQCRHICMQSPVLQGGSCNLGPLKLSALTSRLKICMGMASHCSSMCKHMLHIQDLHPLPASDFMWL